MSRVRNTLLYLNIIALCACSAPSLEDVKDKASKFIEKGEYESAVVELKNAITLAPSDASIRFQLGKAYFNTHQFESSEKEFRKAFELGFDANECLPFLAASLIRTSSFNAVIHLNLDNINISDESKAKLLFYKVQSYAELGQYQEAKAAVGKSMQIATDSLYTNLAAAYSNILDSEYDDALSKIKKVKADNEDNEDLLRVELRLQLGLSNFAEAKDIFKSLIQLRPTDYATQFSYLAVLMDTQDYETAKPLVIELTQAFKDNPLLSQMLGVIYVGEGKFDLALPELEFAINFGLDTDVSRLMAGYSAYQMKDYDTSVKHLELIRSKMYPGHPALRVLADSQLKIGKTIEASETLEAIDGKGTNDHSLFVRVSDQLLQIGNEKLAKKFVTRSSALAESSSELLQTGILELSLRDISGVEKLELASAEGMKSDSKVYKALGAAHMASGAFQKASDLANRLKLTTPLEPYPYILSMNVFIATGKLEQAREEISRALELAPNDPEVLLASIRLAEKSGDIEAAIELVDSLMNKHPDYIPAYIQRFSFDKTKSDVKRTIRKVSERVEEAPSVALYLLLGEMYRSINDTDMVIKSLESIRPNRVAPLKYWQLKGKALLDAKRYEQASNHYQTWINLMPFNEEAMLGVLLIKNNENEYIKGLQLASDFLERTTDQRIVLMKAHFHSMLGEIDAGKKEFASLQPQVQKSQFALEIEARLNAQAGEYSKALDNIKRAYQQDKKISNLKQLVFILEENDEYEEAFNYVQQYVQSMPDDVTAKSLFAERLESREPKLAIRQYQDILQIEPDNFHAINNLALLYKAATENEKAFQFAQKAYSMKPSSPDAIDTLAQMHTSRKQYKQALELYMSIPVNSYLNDEVVKNYIEVLMYSKNREKALRLFEDQPWESDHLKSKAMSIIERN